jgi:WD40 repeat protein/class 3 adenylate cyclase
MDPTNRPGHSFDVLPSGTVTFLFTDIEGSTELLKQLKDDYAALLAEHHKIMREAFSRWDGQEVDTQGDSFFISFPRATQAVAAVVELQKVLAEHEWPQGVEVRVRMGLHTGEPLVAEEGYVGMDVHRAARIAHVGHGGQVLLSETTTSLILDDLPAGVSLVDLGRHLLKDMNRPEHIRQLVIEGLPSKFPPLSSLEMLPSAAHREPRSVGDCPYQGLAAFHEEDAQFFFGREKFTTRLMKAVKTQPMVAVIVGSSGSGKSSAVFAGLLPRLREQSEWQVAIFRPGAHPFYALAGALMPMLEPEMSETDRLAEIHNLAERLKGGEITLHHVMERVQQKSASEQRLLLVIDQFEELYTLCPDVTLQGSFIDELLALVEAVRTQREASFVILLTLRADFMGQALTHRPFADALQEASLIMGPMTKEELRMAIEKPAEVQGAAFEAGLVERILEDVGQEPGNLPLLEFALTLLWEAQDDGWLTHTDYEAIGCVEGALACYADEIFGDLSEEEKLAARRVFVQLVRPGEGTEDTRRVARRSEFREADWKLAQVLAGKRLVVTGHDASLGVETVEVVHEALITNWGQLQAWMEEDRAFRIWQERLRATLRQWQTSGQDEGVLLRGSPLLEAEGWLERRRGELSPEEIAFIQASVALRDRRTAERESRRRRIIFGLAGGLVVALALALVAGLQWRRADEAGDLALSKQYAAETAQAMEASQRAAAETAQAEEAAQREAAQAAEAQALRAEKISFSRELASAAVYNLETDPELSILLAIQALEMYQTQDAINALHQSVVNSHLLQTIDRNLDLVMAMHLSPDGSTLAVGGFDSMSYLWDVETGEQLSITLPENPSGMGGIVYHPDGEHFATTGFDGLIKLWEFPEGMEGQAQELLVMETEDNICPGALFSPNGELFACANNIDGSVRVWDSMSGELLHKLCCHEIVTAGYQLRGATALAFSADGTNLFSAGTDGTIRIWELASGQEVDRVDVGSPLYGLAISPDGSRLAVSTRTSQVYLWQISHGDSSEDQISLTGKYSLSSKCSADRALTFSPDGTQLATGGWDAVARVWDVESGDLLLSLPGHDGIIQQVVFSQDGMRLFSVGQDNLLKFWDLSPGHEVAALPGVEVAYSPDGTMLAHASDDDNVIRLLDSTTLQSLYELKGHKDIIQFLSFSPDGLYLSSSSSDGTAWIWDLMDREVHAVLNHQHVVIGNRFSPDGRYLGTVSMDGSAVLWDVKTGQLIRTLISPVASVDFETYYPEDVDFYPDGSRVAVIHGDGTVKVWEVESGQLRMDRQLASHALSKIHFRPSGDDVVVCSEGSGTQVYDISGEEWQLLFTVFTPGGTLRCAYSPDGSMIAGASHDGTTRVWDAETGEEMMTLYGMPDFAYDPSFSPDGKHLAVAGGQVSQIYALQLEDLVAIAQSRVTRSLTELECQEYLHMEACPE